MIHIYIYVAKPFVQTNMQVRLISTLLDLICQLANITT